MVWIWFAILILENGSALYDSTIKILNTKGKQFFNLRQWETNIWMSIKYFYNIPKWIKS